jgi:hypothetical protein
MERRLSAILAADVVGYSALMEQDEAGTLALQGIEFVPVSPLSSYPTLRSSFQGAADY